LIEKENNRVEENESVVFFPRRGGKFAKLFGAFLIDKSVVFMEAILLNKL
jgi:hypothetical protein